jgi:GT2 family glycosyltransferase
VANLGFARAVNRAAQEADAEFHILVNLDAVVLDQAIEDLSVSSHRPPIP